MGANYVTSSQNHGKIIYLIPKDKYLGVQVKDTYSFFWN